jgi:hypothetical protein
MNKTCKGCLINEMCPITDYDSAYNCPCKECLVKPTCNDPCDLFKYHIKDSEKK